MGPSGKKWVVPIIGLCLALAWWIPLTVYVLSCVLLLMKHPAAMGAGVELYSAGLNMTVFPLQPPEWLGPVEVFLGSLFGAVSLYVMYQIRVLYRHVRLGQPFAPDAHKRLHNVGWCLLAQAVASSVLNVVRGFILCPRIPGAYFDVARAVNWMGFALAVIAFALGEVFRHGLTLDEEVKLTV
jgi:hypothetical protein